MDISQLFIDTLPPNMGIVISEYCPLSCIMCVQRELSKKDSFMKKELFFEIIKQLEDMPYWKPNLVFNCFESFAHPDILDILSFAFSRKNAFNRFIIDTNGQLLTRENTVAILDQLEKNNCPLELNISLDAAWEKTYKSIKKSGCLKVVEDNIIFLLEERKKRSLKVPGLRIQFLVLWENIHEIEQFLENWQGKMLRYNEKIMVGSCHDFPPADCIMVKKAVPNFRYNPDTQAFKNICRKYGLPYCENKEYHNFQDKPYDLPLPCGWPFSWIIIRANGYIIPCQSAWNKPFGKLPENTIKDVLFGENFKNFRLFHSLGIKKDFCHDCDDQTLTDGENNKAIIYSLDLMVYEGKIDKATELLENALKLGIIPDEAVLHLANRLLNNWNLHKKNGEKAALLFEKWLNCHPDDMESKKRLIYLLKDLGENEKALAYIEEIPAEQRCQKLIETEIWLKLKCNLIESAFEIAEKLIKNNENHSSLFLFGLCQLEKGLVNDARKTADLLLKSGDNKGQKKGQELEKIMLTIQ